MLKNLSLRSRLFVFLWASLALSVSLLGCAANENTVVRAKPQDAIAAVSEKAQGEGAADGDKTQDESAGDGKKAQDESAGDGKKAQDESAGDGKKTQDESAGGGKKEQDESSAADGKKAQDESAADGKKAQDESAGDGKKAQGESAANGTKTEDESAVVGKTAPDFTLRDTNGQTHQLSRLIGKFVVLEWWFNDGCPFVRKHYNSNNMQSLQKEFTGKGVVWYTISSAGDGKQGSHTLAEYNKILAQLSAQPTALLLDPDGKVGHLYQAKTTPDRYVIDKTGKLIYAGAIDDTPSSETDDIPKSTNYVRAALAEALSGKKVTVATTKPYGCSVKYAN